ncbi:MAG: hypothetical protein U9N49_06905 [Campylobacterota bacterium]|nr:hypothetical protein [Campylobacterota bacterium]
MLQEEISKHIKKLPYPLKEEDELKTVLKKRLTKKEFKIIEYNIANLPMDEKLSNLNIDQERYDVLEKGLIKKLNYEKIKHQLMQIKE